VRNYRVCQPSSRPFTIRLPTYLSREEVYHVPDFSG
jgi:hypothetical protein